MANCISPFFPNLLNSTSPIRVTSEAEEFLDFLSAHASDIRIGLLGNLGMLVSIIIFRILDSLSIKHDCISISLPSVTELPVMSK